MSNVERLVQNIEEVIYSNLKSAIKGMADQIRSYEEGCPMEELLDVDFEQILENVETRLRNDLADDMGYIEEKFDGDSDEEDKE